MAIYRNQVGAIADAVASQFFTDVIKGLGTSPKYLSSKYFYDEAGDRLFQQIMSLPEYYLTRAEMEIFSRQTAGLAAIIMERFTEFDIVELGAGDATKSSHLLSYLKYTGRDFTYYPVDISKNIIRLLEKEMPRRINGMKVKGLNGDYSDMIRKSYEVSDRRKVVLFLGSSIGNFTRPEAAIFLSSLHEQLLPGDLLLVGFDLKKDPYKILAAYNDAAGITKQFNLNLLKRINRELEANFNIAEFEHYPTYDPVTGACRSYLISRKEQQVIIGNMEMFYFAKDEPVNTELSQKYSVEETDSLALKTGFRKAQSFFDSNRYFMDVLWERQGASCY